MDKVSTNSTRAKYLSYIDQQVFLNEVNRLRQDRYTKKLTALKFVKLMMVAQIQQTPTLTDISAKLSADERLQRDRDLPSISTAQLSRKLRDIEPELVEKALAHCVHQVSLRCGSSQSLSRITRLHLIDSSTLSMCLSQYRWADFRRTKAGVKIHLRLVFQDGFVYPEQVLLTHARPADRSKMDDLVVSEEGALNVFDRGYVDYKKFDDYCKGSIHFVTRLKENAVIHEVIEERLVAADSSVTREALVRLGSLPKSVMQHTLRLIETRDGEGNRIVILTNDLAHGAQEICDIYRKRWQIELFFKWVKQHLILKRLYGKSERAVYNQIRIALIAYCVLLLLQHDAEHQGRLLTVYKCLRLCWDKTVDEFLTLLFPKCKRKSRGRRRLNANKMFEETTQQYDDGNAEHLDWLTYDPLI